MSITVARVSGPRESPRPEVQWRPGRCPCRQRWPARSAAAVFTSNRFKANPVLWSEQVVSNGDVRAVVLNSGGANCGTGPAGFQVTHATAELAAELLDDGAASIVVCSTGLIGPLLDRDRVLAVRDAAQRPSDTASDDAARAIMTTDSVSKQASSPGDGWSVGGMAKGAGMLAPALATMLVVVTTDADVTALIATGPSAPRPARPSTGSTPTGASPPTTPCCCWPPVLRRHPDPEAFAEARPSCLRRPRRPVAP